MDAHEAQTFHLIDAIHLVAVLLVDTLLVAAKRSLELFTYYIATAGHSGPTFTVIPNAQVHDDLQSPRPAFSTQIWRRVPVSIKRQAKGFPKRRQRPFGGVGLSRFECDVMDLTRSRPPPLIGTVTFTDGCRTIGLRRS